MMKLNGKPLSIIRISVHPYYWEVPEVDPDVIINKLRKKFPQIVIETTLHPKQFFEEFNVDINVEDDIFVELQTMKSNAELRARGYIK